METLAHELIERICEFLHLNDLKNTVTLSPGFQYASERASGAFTQFDLTRDNVQNFINLYSGRRWSYLRHVRFTTHIPPYEEDESDEDEDEEQDDAVDGESGKRHRCRESLEELREKDELFTKDIEFVFTTLRTIEDPVSSGKLQLTIYTPIRDFHAGCPHRKCTSWRLHLLNPDALPELASVRALSLENKESILPLEEEKSLLKVDLRILIDLAVKLPRLEFIGCKLDAGSGWTTDNPSEAARHYTRDWVGPHRDSRHDFAKALENAAPALPPTLRQAQLDFLWPLSFAEWIDQTQQAPNLLGRAAHDPFSASLRLLSYQLRKLELKIVADATLFWPTDSEASWPYLESICVLFHISSPSGCWYFDGPKSDGYEGLKATSALYPPLEDTADDKFWDEYADDHGLGTQYATCTKFRVKPNDKVLVPFLTAFGKAVSKMPAIKEACLWTPLKWYANEVDGYEDYDGKQISSNPDEKLGWGITYIAPATLGFHLWPGQHYSASRQLWWTTGQWQPSDELRQLFQHFGDQNTELIEYWGHDVYGQKLALRGIFEQFEIFGYRHPGSPWRVELSEH